jgi:ferrous iron transport protein B
MKRMALVGMPNTGKSTLFNHLTGGAARIANWPGLTVEITTGRALLGKYLVHVADLPGIYDLEGGAEDERLAHAFLAETPLDAVLLVLNATQLDRPLYLLCHAKFLPSFPPILPNISNKYFTFFCLFYFSNTQGRAREVRTAFHISLYAS